MARVFFERIIFDLLFALERCGLKRPRLVERDVTWTGGRVGGAFVQNVGNLHENKVGCADRAGFSLLRKSKNIGLCSVAVVLA